MGIYEATTLYHGRMLSPVGFQRLDRKQTRDYVSSVCHDRWLLHAPGKRIILGSLDAVIEAHEKQAGHVAQAEVDKLLSRHPKLKTEWSSTTEEQLDNLRKLVKIAAADESAEPGTYICETSWSTLDSDTSSESLTYNLRVV